MLKLYTFDRGEYTLIIVEDNNFVESDLNSLKEQYLDLRYDTGVGIAAAPGTNIIAIADVFSHFYKNSSWQAGYVPKLHGGGLLVRSANRNSGRVVGEFIKMQLPCLECYRYGKGDIGVEAVGRIRKYGSLYPYCKDHFASSPHRTSSRRSKPGNAKVIGDANKNTDNSDKVSKNKVLITNNKIVKLKD